MKCDICGKKIDRFDLIRVCTISEKVKQKAEDWISEKVLKGHSKCMMDVNFRDIQKEQKKIQDFKVKMRELCSQEDISLKFSNRMEILMDKYLGE